MKLVPTPLTAALIACLAILPACSDKNKTPEDNSTPAAATAPAASTAVTVNGQRISTEHVAMLADLYRARIPNIEQQATEAQINDAVKRDLVRRLLLEQAAREAKIDTNPEYTKYRTEVERNAKLAMELDFQEHLDKLFQADWLKKTPVTAEEKAAAAQEYLASPNSAPDRKQYEDATKAQEGQNEYHVRHILVEKESEAQALIAKLNDNGNFEELAKNQSLDKGSATAGGDLGWTVSKNWVPPFAAAVAALKTGTWTTPPVKTQFGYHVIKLLEEPRVFKALSFEEYVKKSDEHLKDLVLQKKWAAFIGDLEKKAKIEGLNLEAKAPVKSLAPEAPTK